VNPLLDTDTVIEILRGNMRAQRALAALPVDAVVSVSSITAAELYHGAARSAQPNAGMQQVRNLLAGLKVIPVDETIAEQFGALKSSLQAAGQVVADFDLLIAATALVNVLQVVTHNTRHFSRIPGLALDDWLA
jgi:tRNA(fMet)-specific endonuclease VapC